MLLCRQLLAECLLPRWSQTTGGQTQRVPVFSWLWTEPVGLQHPILELWLAQDKAEPHESPLGLSWWWEMDTPRYKHQSVTYDAPTLRNIYEVLATKYDPSGFFSPPKLRSLSGGYGTNGVVDTIPTFPAGVVSLGRKPTVLTPHYPSQSLWPKPKCCHSWELHLLRCFKTSLWFEGVSEDCRQSRPSLTLLDHVWHPNGYTLSPNWSFVPLLLQPS